MAYRDPDAAQELLDEVRREMDRQDRKWGWPRPTAFLVDDDIMPSLFRQCETSARWLFAHNRPCWMAILGEEIGEVAREADPQARRKELVQVAAVALSWAQAIEEDG